MENTHLLGKSSQGSAVSQLRRAGRGKTICVLVAGVPGSGKSTAINNIFSLTLSPEIESSHSATAGITKTSAAKNGVNLKIIDTPGLGALDMDRRAVTIAMVEALNGVDYTLLYCLSVETGGRLTEMDKTIIQNLHFTLGKEVWDKCVILFTFSDTARREGFSGIDQVSDYKDYLKDMAYEFHQVLQTCTSDVSAVKSIFTLESSGSIFSRSSEKKVVVAIPICKTIDREDEPDILPDVIEPVEDWSSLVFIEMMRKTKSRRRRAFVLFKYGKATASNLGSNTARGALVGAGAGAVVGVLAGPIGMLVVGSTGAAIGAGVGVAVGASVASIVAAIGIKKKKKLKNEFLLSDK